MNQLHLSRLLIAVILVCGFFGSIWSVMYYGIKPDVKDIILVLLGALAGEFKNALGYFFQTSASSVAKDDTIKAAVSANATVGQPTFNGLKKD